MPQWLIGSIVGLAIVAVFVGAAFWATKPAKQVNLTQTEAAEMIAKRDRERGRNT